MNHLIFMLLVDQPLALLGLLTTSSHSRYIGWHGKMHRYLPNFAICSMLDNRAGMGKQYSSMFCPHWSAGWQDGIVEDSQHWLVYSMFSI